MVVDGNEDWFAAASGRLAGSAALLAMLEADDHAFAAWVII